MAYLQSYWRQKRPTGGLSSKSVLKAEADVALLLLKGLGHKEIAAIRETSERTVREQARSLYRKAGISGRSALSAFFLEDLLLPEAERGAATSDPAWTIFAISA